MVTRIRLVRRPGASSPGTGGGGGPQREVGDQPPALWALPAVSQQYLAEVYVGHDLHELVQDVPDQEVRVLVPVVVDLEHPAIAVERTCARVAAKAESGVATVTQALKPVARPDELRQQARARQHDVVAGRRRSVEALAEPGHPEREEHTEERVGGGEGRGRNDQPVAGTVGRRFGHG